MIVKTYRAKDMREALDKIKKDLGVNAVILSSRKVKTGSFFSFFRKEVLEVTAALDEKQNDYVDTTFKTTARRYKTKSTEQSIAKKSSFKSSDIEDRIKKLEKMIVENKDNSIEKVVDDIKYDLNDLKNSLRFVAKKSDIDISKLPLGMSRYFQYMCDIGINKKYAFKISVALHRNLDQKRISDESYVKEYLSVVLSQFFKTSKPDKKRFVLVGPTGVGKTTTIAKLAAIHKLKMNRSVGIITTDTYRIGAVDQLLSYAKIMDIPAIVSITRSDFEVALKEFENMDNVFIDTVGRSQNDIKRLGELFSIFKNFNDLHISLVLSMNTKESDCFDVYNRFSNIPIDDFIYTKVDETSTPGTMLNLSVKLKKPVSYITFGQDVPDDIMVAESLKISSLIVKKEV